MVRMHGQIVDFTGTRAWVLAVFFLFFSPFVVDLRAEEVASQGKASAVSKEDRLKERDRYAQDTMKLRDQGKIQEAIEACGKALAIERVVFGDFHEEVVGSLEHLAKMREELGDFEAAEKALREVLSIREKLHGKAHWRVTDTRLDLNDLKRRGELGPRERSEIEEAEKLNKQVFDLWRKGRSKEALPLAQKAVEIRGKILGKESRGYLLSLFNLGSQYKVTGNLRRAEEAYLQACEIQKKALGEMHPDYAVSLGALASVYQDMGDYARAEPLYRQALDVQKKALGEEHQDYARTLNNLASLYGEMGDRLRAEPLLRQALEFYKKVLGEEHPDYAMALNNLAMLYKEMGSYARAEPLLKQVIEINKKALGEDHPNYATGLSNLAQLYHATGDYARAEPLYRQDLEITRKFLGETHPDYATGLNCLGVLYHEMGDYPRAEATLRQALEIRKKALGERHPSYATSLNNLAGLYREMGDYARAEPLQREAVQSAGMALGARHPGYAAKLNGLATLYHEMGDYAQAERLYQQAIEIRREVLGEEHPDCATSLNNLGVLYDDMGHYARAEPLFKQALEIIRKALGEGHPDYATSLSSLAVLRRKTGDYAGAEPLYRQALEIKKKALGERHPDYARSLGNLAVLYDNMGDYARAEQLYLQALEITKTILGQNHPAYAVRLIGLGSLYHEVGDHVRAEPLFREALEIQKTALGEGHPDCAVVLNDLGSHYRATGDYARAEPLYKQALEITKKTLGEEHPDYAVGLENLAGLYQAMEDYTRAEPLARQALEVSRRNLDLASSILSERQQLAMTKRVKGALSAYLSMAPLAGVPPDEIYAPVLAWKGAVYARQHRMRLEGRRPELIPVFSELQTVSSRLASLAFAVPDPKKQEAWRRQISELTTRKEELEAELSGRSAEYGREKAVSRLSAKDLRSALPAEAVLIDIFEYTRFSPRQERDSGPSEKEAKKEEKLARKSPWSEERRLAGFVIRNGAPAMLVDLGPSVPIEESIRAWRSAIVKEPGSKREIESATILRRSLLEPLEKHIRGARLVLLSPDGALGRLPLSALPGSKPGTYLVEEVSIALLPVPQLLPELLAVKKPLDSPPSLLLVGDVDFDAGLPGPDLAAVQGAKDGSPEEGPILRNEAREAPRGGGGLNFKRLDSTRGEMLMVGDTFEAAYRGGRLLRLRDSDATEAAIRNAVAQHEFIHLATHGFFAPEELKSALAPSKTEGLERPDGGLGPGGNVIGWHPALLSGIVLAGANGRPDPERDDGILTALELATLDLVQTELMVLSACETGLGATAGGEGLLGLQRAAQMAGARTVIASLWKVDDIATQALMARFYRNLWAKKMPKVEALREAQLAMLHGDLGRGVAGIAPSTDSKPLRVSPKAWAAWVLSGDWR